MFLLLFLLKLFKNYKKNLSHTSSTAGRGPTGHNVEISSRAMKTDEVADLFGSNLTNNIASLKFITKRIPDSVSLECSRLHGTQKAE